MNVTNSLTIRAFVLFGLIAAILKTPVASARIQDVRSASSPHSSTASIKEDGFAQTIVSQNADSPTAAVIVAPTDLTTTEGGGQATFEVSLDTLPLFPFSVVIDLASSDATEGTVSPGKMTFTFFNGLQSQTATVTGVDDFTIDGDIPFTTQVDVNQDETTDPFYKDLEPGDVDDVLVTNLDDDEAGITIEPLSGLLTTEGGGADEFTVVLDSKPDGEVVIDLTSSDESEGSVSPASLTFNDTGADWKDPQTVTVTGADDDEDDGDVEYSIEVAVNAEATEDPDYAGLPPQTVSVTNADDAPGYTITPTTGLFTTEGLGAATVQILLKTKPEDQVTIEYSSSDPGEGVVPPGELIVTPSQWKADTPYELVITGVDDLEDDGDVPYTVTLTTTSDDPEYAAFAGGSSEKELEVINKDAPTIKWAMPVDTGEQYFTPNMGPILLGIESAGTEEPVGKVIFYYWDYVNEVHVDIGEVTSATSGTYEFSLDPSALNPAANQIFAYAESPESQQSTPLPVASTHEWIWIVRLNHLYIPLVSDD